MPSQRAERIGLSPTLRISAQAAQMRARGEDVLDFSAGQPDFPTPERVCAAGIRAIESGQTRYTANSGLLELREAICDSIRSDRGLTYGPEEVLVSPGAKASLYFAFMALLDPGDQILIPSPYWVSYPEQARLAQAEPVFLRAGEDQGFKLRAPQVEEALTSRTRMLLLNSPSNPTGVCYDREDLEPLAELCVERGLWIVADEIYSRLLFDGKQFCGIATLGEDVRRRTLIIDGMSKTYSMTGWRIGYAAGPLEVVSAMARIQSHATSNATSISQWASIEALKTPATLLAERTGAFQERRDLVLERLSKMPGVHCVKPDGSFYAFPNVRGCLGLGGGPQDPESLARYLLEQAQVAVVPGEGFGSAEHLRLSFAASKEQISEGMNRIERALSALHSS